VSRADRNRERIRAIQVLGMLRPGNLLREPVGPIGKLLSEIQNENLTDI